jgi:hypothetical protein
LNIVTSTGIRAITIHAPFERLGHRDDDEHDEGEQRTEATDRGAVVPACFPEPHGPHHHAGLRQGERQEHADHIERNQPVLIAAEDDDERRRAEAQSDDAVREGELVAAGFANWRRHVAIAGDDTRRQASGIRRTRCWPARNQDQASVAALDRVVGGKVAAARTQPRAICEHHRSLRLDFGNDLVGVGERRQPDEHLHAEAPPSSPGAAPRFSPNGALEERARHPATGPRPPSAR